MKKTLKFFASLGVNAVYNHENEIAESAELIAGQAWQEAAAEVMSATGTYVGAVIK